MDITLPYVREREREREEKEEGENTGGKEERKICLLQRE